MPGKGVADIFFMKSQTVPRQNLLCSNLAIDLNQLQLSHVITHSFQLHSSAKQVKLVQT